MFQRLDRLGDFRGIVQPSWLPDQYKGCYLISRFQVSCQHKAYYADYGQFSGDDWTVANPARNAAVFTGQYMYEQGWLPSYEPDEYHRVDLPEVVPSPPELEQEDFPLRRVKLNTPDGFVDGFKPINGEEYYTDFWIHFPLCGQDLQTGTWPSDIGYGVPDMFRETIGWSYFVLDHIHLPGTMYQEARFFPELYATAAAGGFCYSLYLPAFDGFPIPLVAASGLLLAGGAAAMCVSGLPGVINNAANNAARRRKPT
jgi:hypothetical protein